MLSPVSFPLKPTHVSWDEVPVRGVHQTWSQFGRPEQGALLMLPVFAGATPTGKARFLATGNGA
jgi:hypothetical protein